MFRHVKEQKLKRLWPDWGSILPKKYGCTLIGFAYASVVRLRQLQMCFNSYKMGSKNSMVEHLRKISANDTLSKSYSVLIDEQQIIVFCDFLKILGNYEANNDPMRKSLHILICCIILKRERWEFRINNTYSPPISRQYFTCFSFAFKLKKPQNIFKI